MRGLEWRFSPVELVRAWPADRRLAALVSAESESEWSRWSILAAPAEEVALGGQEALDWLGSRRFSQHATAGPPFVGGWIGHFEYELGGAIEPAVGLVGAGRRSVWLRCPGAYVFDHSAQRWMVVGDGAALPGIDELEAAAHAARRRHGGALEVGPMRSRTRREEYERAVARAVELIHAGDVFQVNLSHELAAEFSGSHRELFVRAHAATAPWFGALLESEAAGGAVMSLSPELFLDVDMAQQKLITRPIKGTRPARAGAEAELLASAKDAAELAMIVDLMRNDLGRIAEPGAVRVDRGFEVEQHGGANQYAKSGVLHGVATVSAKLREGATLEDIVKATFPAGSITGAPKVRAMQIINELEERRRGVYTGAIGFLSDHGAARLSVAIRTATIAGKFVHGRFDEMTGELRYPVGAGIVAESEPAREYEETMHKARTFLRVVRAESDACVVERT